MKQPTIRIAQVEFPTARGFGYTEFQVEHRDFDRSNPIVVTTPSEARMVAECLAVKFGGRIYCGHLPDAWRVALSDYPRS